MLHSIGIIGTGYVGLVSGACFAETGNRVTCVDIDESKIQKLREGKLPIYEPGLEVVVERNVREKRLTFSTKLEDAVVGARIIFLCLPTPPDEDGSADLQYVMGVAEKIGEMITEKHLTDFKIIVNKSTVPVGTAQKVRDILERTAPNGTWDVVSNPEFLREGFAVEDCMKPDRVVIGTRNAESAAIMRDLYEAFTPTGNPIYVLDEQTSEISKYAANAFLAMRISFMNDLSAYCEKVGADIENVRRAIGSDARIGKKFIFPGIGYGGSCFPKDVRALIHSTEQAGSPLLIVPAVEEVNKRQSKRFVERIIARFDGNIQGKHFGIWGIAFKPNTDDTREAPAFTVIDALLDGGATVCAYDPEAKEGAVHRYGNRIEYAENMYDVAEKADALIITTEWKEFRKPDFEAMRNAMNSPIIFDGRNLYDLDKMPETGFEYHSIGRKSV